MPLLELKELKRLGYGFGSRQPGLLVTVARAPASGLPPHEQVLTLAESVRSCLADKAPPADMTAGDALPFLLLANWALALQRRARIPVFAQPILLLRREVDGGAVHSTGLMPHVDAEAARIALDWAIGLVNDFGEAVAKGEAASMLAAVPAKIDEAVGRLVPRAPSGVNSYRICEAAFQERIPYALFFRDVLLLGEGTKLKRMLSTITDRVSPISVSIARNKMQTAMALRQAGFPTVRHSAANSEDHAVKLAAQSGYPTVVKPADADGGAGVAAGLMTEDAVRSAYREARKVSKNVIVEGFVAGNSYRIHVCNGQIVKTTLRRPGGVDGDGVTSIRDLVARRKDDPQSQRRRLERGRFLLDLDDEARQLLGETGMTEDTVPQAGQFVPLRRRSNVSTGGTTEDVWGTLHPDNEAMFRRAADVLGLDFAGIDYISPDISISWHDVPSAICEINAQPQLGNDLNPTLYNDLLREYLGGPARIPWTLVLGGAPDSRAARSLGERIRAGMDKRASPAVLASADGVWIGSSCISRGQNSLVGACESVVLGRFAAAAVMVADHTLAVAHGLPTGELDFAVLVNEPRQSRNDVEISLHLVIPHIRKGMLLEADDPAFPFIKARMPVSRLITLTAGPADDAVRAHLEEGGSAVWIEGADGGGKGNVVFGVGGKRIALGGFRAAELDRQAILDLLAARLIQVQLPLNGRSAGSGKGS